MARTDNLRQQHASIVKAIETLSGYLTEAKIASDAAGVKTALNVLTGKLGVHLAMEDKVLYPELMKASDPNIKATSEKFAMEMGGIAEAFTAYASKWTENTVRLDPAGFINETNGIFGVLSKRVGEEESVLYPMADSL
jgi:iron-sulfur cluster repair protein YtfE (RIC family)